MKNEWRERKSEKRRFTTEQKELALPKKHNRRSQFSMADIKLGMAQLLPFSFYLCANDAQ